MGGGGFVVSCVFSEYRFWYPFCGGGRRSVILCYPPGRRGACVVSSSGIACKVGSSRRRLEVIFSLYDYVPWFIWTLDKSCVSFEFVNNVNVMYIYICIYIDLWGARSYKMLYANWNYSEEVPRSNDGRLFGETWREYLYFFFFWVKTE